MAEVSNLQVQRQTLVCLLVAQAVVIAPLFLHLPLWLGLLWLLAVTIRVQVHRGAWRYPGNFVKTMLALISIGGLFAQYGVNLGVEPMVGLLLSAFMLKLVEARQRRDLLLIIFIGYVAVAAQFLFSQTLFAACYGLVSALALLAAWRSCFSSRSLGLRSQFKQSGVLVLQAVPLMVLLFILLPRIGPLWAVPPTQSTGTTGFSDSMAPGDIAELSLSSATAFRVSFEGPEPPSSQMYWRGLVLDYFDGRSWSSSETRYGGGLEPTHASDTPDGYWPLARSNNSLSYRVMLEPHQERWLFFLDTPVSIKAGFRTAYTENYLIKSRWPMDSRAEYRVTSDLGAKRAVGGLQPDVARRSLQLPLSPANPRAHQLVESWQGLTPPQIVQRALSFYHQEFSYTLRPPPLGSNTIDEFLFITRKGFCEHFAGSFVYLMRAAGIPARVVLGYQGGERSEVGDYWLVRQSASHAWAEVWLEGAGWVTVDPTGVVAPDRIEYGLQEALGSEEVYLAGGETLLGVQDWPWLRRLRHQWDALGYAWHRVVLGYDSEAQSGLLQRLLGGVDPWRIGLALLGGAGALLGLYGLVFWFNNRRSGEALEVRLLRQAERRLGVTRQPDETPAQWAARAAMLRPQKAGDIRRFAALFEQAVYAGRREFLYKLQVTVKALRRR